MTYDLIDFATEFQFKLYPEGHHYWDIGDRAVVVAWRGGDKWAVLNRHFCCDGDGNMEYESIPSDRSDEFKARFRFTRDEAIRVARDVIVPMERTATDAMLSRKAGAK